MKDPLRKEHLKVGKPFIYNKPLAFYSVVAKSVKIEVKTKIIASKLLNF